MKCRINIHRFCVAVVLTLLCLFATHEGFAQTGPSDAAAPRRATGEGRAEALKAAAAQPTPRLADGHPDLSGVWASGSLGTVAKDETGGRTIFSPSPTAPKDVDPDGKYNRIYETLQGNQRREANPNKPPYKPELLAKVKDLDINENQEDPVITCHPAGITRSSPEQIFAVPGYVVLFFMGENGNRYRVIRTDGSAHPKNLEPSYYGDASGHWEGDTLVVDIVGFNDKTWLGSSGWFHSTALHITERYMREGNVLHYQATVEDPNVLTKPWVPNARTNVLNTEPNNYVYEEYPCMDFDQSHFVNHDHI